MIKLKTKLKKLDIYLDIDGVVLGTKSSQKDIAKLIKHILKHYPDNTYWLTTHCKGGANRCAEWLKQNGFSKELADEMDRIIKPTDWGVMKTEAINMSRDFVWLDDSIFATERQTLEAHHVLGCFYRTDPKDPKTAKRALRYLKTIR